MENGQNRFMIVLLNIYCGTAGNLSKLNAELHAHAGQVEIIAINQSSKKGASSTIPPTVSCPCLTVTE